MDSPKRVMTISEQIRPWRWYLISALLGLVLICFEVISLIFGFNNTNGGLLGLGLVLWLIFYLKLLRHKTLMALAQARRAQLLEEEELKRIKKTMTAAEWELYKVQKENQKLLSQINAKPAQPSGPKPIFGIVNDISD